MAPRDTPKVTPKILGRPNSTKTRSSPLTVKKTSTKKQNEKITSKVDSVETRQRTSTVPKVSSPKSKDLKPVAMPGSVKKAAWKRRPKPAHSGVPVPEKMKKLLQKQLMDSDCSL